ncbi:MAG: thiamine pyrophosphate-binding protein [Actinomycetota bacterium]
MTTGREAFFEIARSEGARYLFTNPGTTELPIFDELAEDGTGIELIMCLQEGVAVGAADGYAQATGRPSLINLHVTPGLANGLNGIFDAAWSRSPIVVTAGQQDTRHLVQEPMLAGDLVGMVSQFTKYAYECRRPEEIGIAMRRAFKEAAEPPSGPTFVSIPWDVFDQDADFEIPGASKLDHHATASAEAIAEAARMLLDAGRPLIVAGDGIARADAVAELVRVAELIGARVAGEPIHGRLNFPFGHPLYAGMIAPMNPGIRASLEQADVAFIAAASAFSPFYPSSVMAVPSDVTLLQLDPDPKEIARIYPVALGMVGDPKASLRALGNEIDRVRTPEQSKRADARTKEAREQKAAGMAALWGAIDEKRSVDPIPPIVAVAEITSALEPGTIVVDESITSTLGVRSTLKLSEPGTYFFTRGGGLGFGLPASIGVKLARPDRPVVAIVGDGTTLYTPQALWTMAHHHVPVVSVVLNNASYLILKSGLAGMQGKAVKNDVWPAMDIVDPRVDFLALARAFDVPAERVDKAADIGPAIRKAFASGGPALVEVVVDGRLGA